PGGRLPRERRLRRSRGDRRARPQVPAGRPHLRPSGTAGVAVARTARRGAGMSAPLDIVALGLSLRSSWGNGHATTWRALIGARVVRGHRVTFLERDVPWYADRQDAAGDLPGT